MKKLNALLFNQGGKCFYCDAILDINEATIEHVIPQSKGGTSNLDNLVICCKYANHAFRDYSPKQKMAVIKQLCCSPLICKKIFPRKEEFIEQNDIQDVPLIENNPETVEKQLPIISEANKTKASIKKSQPELKMAYQLLRQAIESLEHNGREATNSIVKNQMLVLNPLFKESDYGFAKFNKFLLSAQENKVVTLKTHNKAGTYIIKKK